MSRVATGQRDDGQVSTGWLFGGAGAVARWRDRVSVRGRRRSGSPARLGLSWGVRLGEVER